MTTTTTTFLTSPLYKSSGTGLFGGCIIISEIYERNDRRSDNLAKDFGRCCLGLSGLGFASHVSVFVYQDWLRFSYRVIGSAHIAVAMMAFFLWFCLALEEMVPELVRCVHLPLLFLVCPVCCNYAA